MWYYCRMTIMQRVDQLTLADFDYHLPEVRIAQEPIEQRDRSRLMTLNRATGGVDHRIFYEIVDLLHPGDLLVVNDTKVVPCRLPAEKQTGGKAEVFLLEEKGLNQWEALVKGGVGVGKSVLITPGIRAEVVATGAQGVSTIVFHADRDIKELLSSVGKTPLPPYIRRDANERDRERYQTVYASREGAVAAPTAGLHFTDDLIGALRDRRIEIHPVTLHVGPGTFLPVRTERIVDHVMHHEQYDIPPASAESIMRAKVEGRRIIAVGTTAVRTLETAALEDGVVAPGQGASGLFIYPGYRFKVIDGMITNFHLPKSTLLMLVAAFAGREHTLAAYQAAVQNQYRFYSYGDAMLIV